MSEDERGLDHLMEQNETELPFLSAYGGTEGTSSAIPTSILEALVRYLKAGGGDVVQHEGTVEFGFGQASITQQGCLVVVEGEALPLVASDMMAEGFVNGTLAKDRSQVSVVLTDWGAEQRRFIERLVENALQN